MLGDHLCSSSFDNNRGNQVIGAATAKEAGSSY
jgi:hypothetical protein